ncbi:MAG: phage terminase large subunit [Clostridia bacterium]|nr:phage terminase large subunit [Clostridia bacterium]
MSKVIWTPQPKQAVFLSRPEYEVFYGGAAGGGKSDALVIEALRQVHIPHYRALILRKTYPELTDLIEKSINYYTALFPKAKYNDSKHVWTFPSGAKIYFGAMQYTKDRTKYQGKAYDFIAFDELTHFAYDEYSYLFSRNRPSGPGTRVYIRATGNPGGVGHAWVKERFITAAKPMTPIAENVKVSLPGGGVRELVRKRMFIPSSVFDNQKLLENDPNYLASLALLPEAERRALLYGDWDSFSGQVFSEWVDDSDHYNDRQHTHVIAPFRVPPEWRIYRGFDWGYAKPFSVGWYAVDYDKRIYRIRELYGCTDTPDVGVKWEPAMVARKIREIENEDLNLKGKHITGVADPAIFADDRGAGTSIGALMEKEGVFFDKGNHERLSGKMQMHNRLRFDENGIPMFYVFNTCKHFIRTVPSLVYSQTDVEDVDTKGEDHIYDECRYVLMEYPITPKPIITKAVDEFDPLELNKKYGRYDFYSRV